MRLLQLLPLVLVGASTASAQVLVGPVFQVDTQTTIETLWPSVACDAAGNFVVVWQSTGLDGSGRGIFGRQFEASGAPRGAEFQVNTYTPGNQGSLLNGPAVASDGAGNYTVVWQNEWNAFDTDVMGQRYDASGNRAGGEFRVNTTTAGKQYQPALASDASGNVVVAWRTTTAFAGTDLSGQRYNAAGKPIGAEFGVAASRAPLHLAPSVSANETGGFVVAWKGVEQPASGPHPYDGVYAMVPPAWGSGVADTEVQVNSCRYPPDQRVMQAVASLGEGRFVVAWVRSDPTIQTYWVEAQVFGPDGFPVGREISVARSIGTYSYDGLTVVADGPDRFTVVWLHHAIGLVGRSFNLAGVPTSGQFLLAYSIWTNGINAARQGPGRLVVVWEGPQMGPWLDGLFGRLVSGIGSELEPHDLVVDPEGDQVLESGETAAIVPGWRNPTDAPIAVSGTLTAFTGPAGAKYTIVDDSADYGVIGPGQRGDCAGSGDCYSVEVSSVAPAGQHRDALIDETLSTGTSYTWAVHLGDSFSDVPRTHPLYRSVETALHQGLTTGCAAGRYCPDKAASRQETAVFLRVAREGSAACAPRACPSGAGPFADVGSDHPFCPWIDDLARLGVAPGCGGGNFCPNDVVTREQIARFALAGREGPGYAPPSCVKGAEAFTDVLADSPYCPWIEELARRNAISGCGGGQYCPAEPLTRGDLSVVVTVTFGMSLYGPVDPLPRSLRIW